MRFIFKYNKYTFTMVTINEINEILTLINFSFLCRLSLDEIFLINVIVRCKYFVNTENNKMFF